MKNITIKSEVLLATKKTDEEIHTNTYSSKIIKRELSTIKTRVHLFKSR